MDGNGGNVPVPEQLVQFRGVEHDGGLTLAVGDSGGVA